MHQYILDSSGSSSSSSGGSSQCSGKIYLKYILMIFKIKIIIIYLRTKKIKNNIFKYILKIYLNIF